MSNRLSWLRGQGEPILLGRVPSGSKGGRAWFGGALSVVWLFYLIGPLKHSWDLAEHTHVIVAVGCLIPFAAMIVGAFVIFRRPWDEDEEPPRRFDVRAWIYLVIMAALAIPVLVLIGPDAGGLIIYLSVVAIFILPLGESAVVVAVMIVAILVPWSGHSSFSWSGVSVALVPAFIWFGRGIGLRAREIERAGRQQRSELAMAEERNRVARDVHDILGHSLTVITVKTELAQRLLDVDIDSARTELVDIERLAREALAGVRDTVGGLREVSLAGELANAHTALVAAGIDAQLPIAPRNLPPGRQELFGWVLREAVTNIVRHSGAQSCTVTIRRSGIEIIDDGTGFDQMTECTGNGLNGLRQRVAAAGGTLTMGSVNGHGFRLAATFGEDPQ